MIKLRQLSDEAVYVNGRWYSENTAFADALNSAANPKQIRGYYTNIQEEIIKIVMELYKNIEVIEVIEDQPEAIFEAPIY